MWHPEFPEMKTEALVALLRLPRVGIEMGCVSRTAQVEVKM